MSELKQKTIYQSTFLIIHDDELVNLNTDELQSGSFKNDFIEWNDSWKTKPNDAFKHQIRVEDQNDSYKKDKY